jgi:predicted oxidoreductase
VAGDKVEEIDREITAELQLFPGTNRRLIAARNWLGLTFDEKQHLGGVVRRGQRYTVHQGHSCGGGIDVIMKTGYDHTWFVLTQRIIEREFVLSGSDQNPDLTGKNIPMLIKHVLTGASAQIEGFKRDGIDFVVKRNLRDPANGMNRITGEPLIDLTSLQREIEARDREIANPFTKDSQITANRGSRKYLGDKLARTAKPHRLLDPKVGLLITVRLNIVTRKTLGDVETI